MVKHTQRKVKTRMLLDLHKRLPLKEIGRRILNVMYTYCKGISAFSIINNLYIILNWINCHLVYYLWLKC